MRLARADADGMSKMVQYSRLLLPEAQMRTTLLAAVIGLAALFTSSIDLGAYRAGPTVLMIHGGALKAPVFVVLRGPDDGAKYKAFWCGGGRTATKIEEAQVADRPF
jgi:hypothetical protein